jgi:hypothetical protein
MPSRPTPVPSSTLARITLLFDPPLGGQVGHGGAGLGEVGVDAVGLLRQVSECAVEAGDGVVLDHGDALVEELVLVGEVLQVPAEGDRGAGERVSGDLVPARPHVHRPAGFQHPAGRVDERGQRPVPAASGLRAGRPVRGCRYSAGMSRLCDPHLSEYNSKRSRGQRISVMGYVTVAVALPRPVTRPCAYPGCRYEISDDSLCDGHRYRWSRVDRPPLAELAAKLESRTVPGFSVVGLPPLASLEFQYLLQVRTDQRRAKIDPRVWIRAVNTVVNEGVESVRARDIEFWRRSSPNHATFRRCSWLCLRLSATSTGQTWSGNETCGGPNAWASASRNDGVSPPWISPPSPSRGFGRRSSVTHGCAWPVWNYARSPGTWSISGTSPGSSLSPARSGTTIRRCWTGNYWKRSSAGSAAG